MSDFETTADFHAVVDSGSLRSARDTVEEELGDIEVQVAAQTGDAGGGGNAARDRAMGRRLQDQQLDALDDGLQLDEERNRLLEELVADESQQTYDNASRGGRGLGSILGGAIGAAGLGISGIVGAVSGLSDVSPPDLSPGDVVSPVGLDPDDVVSPVALTVSDVVEGPTSVAVGDVVAAGASVTAPALVSSAAVISAGNLVSDPASISASDVIESPLSVGVGDVVSEGAAVTAPAVIASGASLTAPALVDTAATIGPGDLVDSAAELTTDSLLSALGLGSEATGESGQGSGGGGIGAEEVIGGGLAAGAAAKLGQLAQGAGETAGGAASTLAGLPANLAARSAERSQERPEDQQTWFDKLVGDALEGSGLGGQNTANAAGAATAGVDASTLAQAIESAMDTTDSGREQNTPTTFEYSPTYEMNDLRQLRQKQEQDRQELERRIDDLQNSFSGP